MSQPEFIGITGKIDHSEIEPSVDCENLFSKELSVSQLSQLQLSQLQSSQSQLSQSQSRRSNNLKSIISLVSESSSSEILSPVFSFALSSRSKLLTTCEFTQKDFDYIMDCVFKHDKDYLDLSRFDFKIFPQNLIDAFEEGFFNHVRSLDMSFCNLDEIPQCIFCLSSLEELHLGNNSISEIPKEISNFKNLEILDMNGNKLKNLPLEIKELQNLKTLNLTKNNFTFFPKIIFSIRDLEKIYIYGNPRITQCPGYEYLEGMRKLYIEADDHPQLIEEWYHLEIHMCPRHIHIKWNNIFPSKINNNLYLSGINGVSYNDVYDILSINAIISIGRDLKPLVPVDMKHHILPIDDEDTTKLEFDIIDVIHNLISRGNKCIVHCQKGMSRSASIVIAYMMKYHNMVYYDAFYYVKTRRDCINPNPGFRKQLMAFEKQLGRN
jgi:Leucine-rich repeat (LRR) protein